MVKQGWSEERKDVPAQIRDYWNYREELYEIERIMMKGNKIIEPQTLQRDMLKTIHADHFGIEKCKLRARELLSWTGMSKDIERVISRCDVCQTHTQQKETHIPHSTWQRPWQILGTGLFSWHGHDFMILTDYYSRYWGGGIATRHKGSHRDSSHKVYVYWPDLESQMRSNQTMDPNYRGGRGPPES